MLPEPVYTIIAHSHFLHTTAGSILSTSISYSIRHLTLARMHSYFPHVSGVLMMRVVPMLAPLPWSTVLCHTPAPVFILLRVCISLSLAISRLLGQRQTHAPEVLNQNDIWEANTGILCCSASAVVMPAPTRGSAGKRAL